MLTFLQKTSIHAVLISLLVHLLVIAVFVFIKLRSEPAKVAEIYIQLPQAPLVPDIVPQPEPQEPLGKNVLPKVDGPQPIDEIPVEDESVQLDTMQTDSIEKFDRTAFFTQAPQIHYTERPKDVMSNSSDTSFLERMTAGPGFADFNDSTNFNVTPGPANDRIDWDLYRRRGQTPTLPLGQAAVEGAQYLSDLFNKKKKDRPVRLDFVPSKAELSILQTIWQSSSATDTDIYAAMDSSIKITAADMTVVLEKLQNKGLLQREIVSPQHLFSFPLGQVEMSRKNRRNRVYLYKSTINSDEVLQFLQATLYEIEHGKNSLPDSIRTKQADSLREKIMQLIEATG